MEDKNNSFNVYMSSTNFGFLNFRDKNWKKKLISYLPSSFECIDPLRVLSSEPEIVDQDIQDIQNSDFIVCYLGKKITIGTMMEIMYALMYRKECEIELPIIIIDKYKIHRQHPWIKKWISYIVDNEKEASDLIQSLIENNEFE